MVAAFRHFDNRDGFPLLHDHCLVLNRVQRRGDDGEPVWGALDTFRLYRNVVAAGTLYTLAMTTEVCEELGLATVPREVTPGLRPVMEIAGVDSELIDWSSTRRQRIEDVLEGLTYKYAQEHGRLPGEKARHGLGWWAAQDTRPEKKTPRPLKQLLAWWRASALLKFGKQMVDGLVQRCRAAGAAIRARVDPHVDAVLAAVDVAAVVSTVRGTFARRPRPGRSPPAPAGDPARPGVHARPGRLHRRPRPVRPLPSVHRSPARPPGPGRRHGQSGRPAPPGGRAAAPAARPRAETGPPAVTGRVGPPGGTGDEITAPDDGTRPAAHLRDHRGAGRARGTAPPRARRPPWLPRPCRT
ncbi:MobF family relaxase [Streptomyces sp. NPDC057545]|uniref:MobF family relaxase n=1 Tax=Streptomyces sp. NPDC057545 TaxID=3346164 RepID=UPI00368E524F